MKPIAPVLILSLSFFVFGVPSLVWAAGGGGGGGGGQWQGIGGGGGSSRRLSKLFREGTELLAEGECANAEKKFRKVVKAVPKNPEAHFLLGATYRCQGEHKSAIRAFKKAKRYDSELYAAYQMLGASYLELGDRAEAEAELADLSEMLTACAEACSDKMKAAHAKLRAALEVEAGAPERGDGARESGSESEPSEPHSLWRLRDLDARHAYLDAVRQIHAQQFEAAIDALRDLAFRVGPDPDILNYLGFAHRKLRRFDRAQTYYERALALDPDHLGANEYLGELWIELGRVGAARAQLERLDRLCPFGCSEYEDLRRLLESAIAAVDPLGD